MKELFYSDIEDLCLDVSEVHDKLCENDKDYFGITIVAKYEIAKQVISELVYYDYKLDYIEFESPDIDCYEDEFYISVNSDGEICCEKAKSKDGIYLVYECGIVLIHEDCNSKILEKIRSDYKPMIFVLSDDCDEDKEYCRDCEDREKCDLEDKNDRYFPVKLPVVMDNEDDNTKWFSFHKNEDGKSIDISLHVTDNIKQDELKYIFDNLIYI